MLEVIATSDEDISLNIKEADNQLYISLASGKYLDLHGQGLQVPRDTNFDPEDDIYRNLITIMSTYPKQIKKTIYDLMSLFWSNEYIFANVTSNEFYDLSNDINLTGTISFMENSNKVIGVGTSFTTEIQFGDYIKISTQENSKYVRVEKVIDNNNLELSYVYVNKSKSGIAKRERPKNLEIQTDNSYNDIYFIPTAFNDMANVSISDIIDFIELNSNGIASFNYENKVRIRTKTPGLSGWIQVLGGTANSVMGFSTNKIRYLDNKDSIAIYEINPNEIVVKIPYEIPSLTNSLIGTNHLNYDGYGIINTIDNTNKIINITTRGIEQNIVDYYKNNILSREFNEFTVISSEAGVADGDYFSYNLTFSSSDNLSSLTVGNEVYLLDPEYPGCHLFDLEGSYNIKNGRTKLTSNIASGNVLTFIQVEDTSLFDANGGYLILDFGNGNEESKIRYYGVSEKNLYIDSSYVWQNNHAIGEEVCGINLGRTVEDPYGSDYGFYLRDLTLAREYFQTLIELLVASGIKIRWIINETEYYWDISNNNLI
jgi:hypothetical protein